MTSKILSSIKEKTKTTKSIIFDDGTGMKAGNFTIDAFDQKLTVFFTNYNFKDKTYYDKCIEKRGVSFLNSTSNQYYMKSKLVYNAISINVVSISGHFKDNIVAQDIQHELEHIFQQTKINSSFNDNDFYNLVRNNVYSNNQFEHHVAMILYMSFKYEIEGFANGLYAYIKKHEHALNINNYFHESDAYEKLEQVNISLEFIKNNISTINLKTVLEKYNQFGVNLENIISIAEKKKHS